MSPILPLLLSLMLVQPAPAADPAPPEATPVSNPMENEYPVPPGAPGDDYGLVAWCYGALAGHMALYDRVIGDVETIEVNIAKIPGAPPADMAAYKTQQTAGKDTLEQFRRAMTAAEKASPKPIAPYGAEALKKGGSIWVQVRASEKKYLAREWMSWGLPGRCLPTAERLEAKSSLFGQALSYNVNPAAPPPPPPAAAAPVPMIPAVDTGATTAAAASSEDMIGGAALEETAETSVDAAETMASGIDDLLPGETAPEPDANPAAPPPETTTSEEDQAAAEEAAKAAEAAADEAEEDEEPDLKLRGPQ